MTEPLSFFLKAKHWQLFLPLMGAMFVGQGVMVAYTPKTADSPEAFQNLIILLLVASLLFMGGVLGWLWTLGRFLSSIVPPQLRLNNARFQFSLVYPVAYMMLFAVVFQPWEPLPWIIPLHLFAMACMFYSLYFVAKSLRLAEIQKPLSFYEYSGPFFLLWFFPIGIWVIQPRVNWLYAQHQNTEPIVQPVA